MGEELEQYKQMIAKSGGLKTLEKYGKSHYSDMGKKGMKKRWGKKRRVVTN